MYYRSCLHNMDEDEIDKDCFPVTTAYSTGNETINADEGCRPKQFCKPQQNAWCENHSLPYLEELENCTLNEKHEGKELNVAARKQNDKNNDNEDFSICKRCLSNRIEFEGEDEDVPKDENLISSKQICICVMDEKSENCLNKFTNIFSSNPPPLVRDMTEVEACNVLDLPDEVILNIFSYFSPTELCRYVAPVCSKWLAYARDSTLWEEISEKEFRSIPTELLVKVITSWCSLLRVLDLKGRTDMSKDDFEYILQSCPHIETLSLAFCDQVNDEILKILCNYCCNLKYVNFEGCKISDSSLIHLFGKPIHGLTLSHCNISDEGIIFIANNFKKIISLDVDGIQWITQSSLEVLATLHGEHLAEITLDGADLLDDSIRILSQCKGIRKFSLSFCDSLTDKSLEWIKQFHHLDYLQLKKGTNFTNLAILSLFENLKHLEGKGLKYLNLSECSSLSDSCLHALSQSCPNLVILHLSWCWEVTDDGINFIFDSCHQIKELHLCGLHELYGIPFRRVQREMPGLTFLDLRQCNKTSDDLLADLASELTSLTILNYYGDVVKANLNFWNLESKCSPGHFHHTSA